MGHHFDSPESRADSRINITDNYLFHAESPGKVVCIMAVSPLAGLPSPFNGEPQWRTFRPDCAYDFRFDTDGDMQVDSIMRLVFRGQSEPQQWEAYWITGAAARDHHANGVLIGNGGIGHTSSLQNDMRVWVGEAGDPFWLDAVAAKSFIDGLVAGGVWKPDQFSAGNTTTAATNVLAIVVELPIAMLGATKFAMYTTVSANDHGHWTQVQRCGRPNLAATFLDDPLNSSKYNGSDPDTDVDNFGPLLAATTAKLVGLAGTAADPIGYGRLVAKTLLPDVIAFDTAHAASFGFAGINGRALGDDFGAVVYSTVFNFPMRTALPPLPDLQSKWPYMAPARALPAGPGVAVPPRNG